MKFKEFDARMRAFEKADDPSVIPGTYAIARLDGRGFTKLLEKSGYTKPFDDNFHVAMTTTLGYLMNNRGFNILYGYTQSDEISLLIDPYDDSFDRKIRKWISVLAGEASAHMTMIAGSPLVFDCRIVLLPHVADVKDYFRWRMADAQRNALNSAAFWTLVSLENMSRRKAASWMNGTGVAEKKNMLLRNNVNFDELESWKRNGTGAYWMLKPKEGFNPKTQEKVEVLRRRIRIDDTLPVGDLHDNLIQGIISSPNRIHKQIIRS